MSGLASVCFCSWRTLAISPFAGTTTERAAFVPAKPTIICQAMGHNGWQGERSLWESNPSAYRKLSMTGKPSGCSSIGSQLASVVENAVDAGSIASPPQEIPWIHLPERKRSCFICAAASLTVFKVPIAEALQARGVETAVFYQCLRKAVFEITLNQAKLPPYRHILEDYADEKTSEKAGARAIASCAASFDT